MKTQREKVLGWVIFVVVLLALAAMINYYFWQKNRPVKSPVSEAAQQDGTTWGVVPETVLSQPKVPAGFVQITNQAVEIATVRNTSVVVHDVGASVKMMPATKEQPTVVPENSIRKQ